MSQFWNFFNLGLGQVLDWQAIDHILFLIVVVAAFSLKDWIRLLWFITLFTLGHILALALSTYNIIMVQGGLVHFLIPLTIFFTALFSLFTAGKPRRDNKIQVFYFISLFLGIIYGIGFSSSFQSMTANVSAKVLPLLEYGLGLLAGQIIVVLIILIIASIIQTIFRFSKRDWLMVISSIVIGFMIPMLLENKFW